MSRRIRLMVTVLTILSQAAVASSFSLGQPVLAGGFSAGTALPEPVLHFPPDWSIGETALINES